MKKFYFLAISLIASNFFLQAQIFQNTTATAAVDAITRSTGCGFGTQPGVNMSDIAIPLAGTIADPTKITINLAISAVWLGDVTVDIVSPQGEAITLIRRIGASINSSCGDSSSFIAANILSFNSGNTGLIDAASIAMGVPVPSGNYAPTLSAASYPSHNPVNMTPFLTGKTLNGTWRMVVYDYGQGDASSVASWQIVVSPGALLKSNEGGVFSNDISLQQNPVKDFLKLNVQKDFKNLVFEIYDASGKAVKQESRSNSAKDFDIDVRTLSPGMYLLIPIKDGERKQTIKFIKQ
ncbi:T9SS type A sorting domain-containing protein [Kaistella jeonii]|uniref:Secretion system C-terminal sorting domain-containing protein n=1 Tax=Kaistella jeonii TaxID=266749 RepID=A0A0C1DA06_9FLAO|nr:T9SS type A sorting domain-containing protein [Kaistella jeonii]KIA90755.1 hypothetical protein OA86_02485 [Kaistella jeonii]SFB68313.1 Por secretion system C-terminal sorting domain-containing protein [Kaistella jeonii]VEI94625.1 Por secretion system C-terminal sorting domain [Kaistella jeonii]